MAVDAQATSQSPAPAIQILPTDILHSIFVDLIKSVPPRDRVSTAIPMAGVCRFWRDIMFSIPFIWDYIGGNLDPLCPAVILNDNPTESNQEAEKRMVPINNFTKRIKRKISKSCDAPLTLDFDAYDSKGTGIYPDEASGWFVPLADALRQTTARWGEATFTIDPLLPWTEPLVDILALPQEEFPQLRKFKLDIPVSTGLNLEKLGILRAPMLRSLSLSTFCVNFSRIQVPWSSLTHLSIKQPYSWEEEDDPPSFGGAQVLDILQNCRDLISCSFVLDKPVVDSDPPIRSRIRLPHLESMSLEGVATANGFASSLDLPSLRTLSLKQEDRGEFMDWILNYGDQLEDLTIYYPSISQWDLHFCLQRLPNLVKFASETPTHSDPNQSAWTWGERNGVFSDFTLGILTPGGPGQCAGARQAGCPKLQEFRFKQANRAAFTEAALVKFIIARTNSKKLPDGFSRLTSVEVNLWYSRKSDIRRELEDWGVNLENLDLRFTSFFC